MRPKFVSERAYNRDALGRKLAGDESRPRRKIVITRIRATIIVLVAYSGSALTAKYSIAKLQAMQGIEDPLRVEFVTAVFLSVIGALAFWSLFNIFRRPKLFE